MLSTAHDRANDATNLRARAQLDALRQSLGRAIPLPDDNCFSDLLRALDTPSEQRG